VFIYPSTEQLLFKIHYLKRQGHQIALELHTNSTPIVHQLHTNCTPTAHQFHTNCTPIAHQLHTNRTPSAHQLHTNCTPTTHQSHTNCTPTTHQLHTNCTPTTHQLHTNYTPTAHSTVLLEKLLVPQLVKKFLIFPWHLNVHCHVHKICHITCVLSQINPVYALSSYFIKNPS